ncbi:uncharacterized protein LOC121597650 isoform X2 [Anopheles merus]|uniref:uncharacterized protein LOC121597650 isoform X2 n=1 Tax=Anopheles merus TaxID=30066 RepID=UPI001BE4E123|nr:uncharacterized protein LOC121597650 isoform X2 [Anopheles merus]
MLAEAEDTELDDTHLCIKCGSTVEGIENYIKHRKANCTQQQQQQPAGKSSGDGTGGLPASSAAADGNGDDDQPTVATPAEPAPYGTFDFGKTVKEQEQHKKVPSYDYHNYELEPHHHHHHHEHHEHHADPVHHRSDGSKAAGADYKNEVNFEYELGADLFFYSLELQSSSKQKQPPATQPGPSAGGVTGAGCIPVASKLAMAQSRPKTRTRNVILASLQLEADQQQQQQQQQQQHHQLPDDWLATPNESDKLMKAVSAISGHKKVELYPIFHQESPEPSDDDSEDEECDYNAPPRTHTGGKWKPENRPSPNALRSTSQWRHWPPGSPLDKSATGEPDEEDADCFKSFPPPPGHTRGKWVPGSKIARLEYKPSEAPVRGYEDNYWCSICNRRLASRHVYERHLQSNLHLKRAQEECELERAIKPTLYANELSKRVVEPATTSGASSSTVVKTLAETDTTAARDEGKRKRKCYYTKCAVCKTRLPTHLLGKHLISRYHYRRMLNHPRHSFDVVLKNMHRIVLQAPFQCQPCRFYANSEHYFMEHWRSGEHEARVAGAGGKFWCSFCKFECEGNFQMTAHLMGANHREVIAVINRSVPIIIRKITRIRCSCCEQEFRYNAELRQHQRHCGAVSERVIDEVRVQVQNTFACELCPASFPNRTRLLQHGQKLHRLGNYYCSICECLFETARESVQHRRTSKHKIMSARKRRKGSLVPKTCSVCKETLGDVLELKEHIASRHPEVKYSCPQCGECFVLAQELGRHVRDKNCTFFNSSTETSSAGPAPYAPTEVLSIPVPSTPTTTTTTHQLTGGAVPAIVPQAETSPSSSATRPHLSGTNSIISNDSIKVNMNDRKLGSKETHLYSSTVAVAVVPPFLESPDAEPEPATTTVDEQAGQGSADERSKATLCCSTAGSITTSDPSGSLPASTKAATISPVPRPMPAAIWCPTRASGTLPAASPAATTGGNHSPSCVDMHFFGTRSWRKSTNVISVTLRRTFPDTCAGICWCTPAANHSPVHTATIPATTLKIYASTLFLPRSIRGNFCTSVNFAPAARRMKQAARHRTVPTFRKSLRTIYSTATSLRRRK